MPEAKFLPTKYEILQRQVIDKLCREGIGPGDRLSSERDLAEEFNVSYLNGEAFHW